MKIELSERYALCILRSLEERESTLSDYRHYNGGDITGAATRELSEIRTVIDCIKNKLLQE